jgi:hypothetical protein
MRANKLLLNVLTKKQLLDLPVRRWDEVTFYDSLLIFSTGEKHHSGWAVMTVIGVNKMTPKEVACLCCDDIEWIFPQAFTAGQLRTDCALKSGAIHFWSGHNSSRKFRVGKSSSSLTINLINE